MKRSWFLLVILLFAIKVNSQPTIQWENCFGGTNDDESWSIIQTNDSSYVVAGFAYSRNGNLDSSNHIGGAWLIKLNTYGLILWQKSYGGSSLGDYPQSIIQTTDGGFIFTGNTSSSNGDLSNTINHGDGDAWVCKLNDTGGVQWSKCYGGSLQDYGESIVQTTDGGYIFAGFTYSNDGDVHGNHGTDVDYWVVKLNDTGAIQWSKCYGGSSLDEAYSIVQTTDGGYIVAGYTDSGDGDVTGYSGPNSEEWIVKIDSLGNIQWEKCFGGNTGGTAAYSIIQTSDGGYLTVGNANGNGGIVTGNHGGNDYWLVKLTDTGDVQWQKCYGGSSDDIAYTVVKTIDGKYAIGGYSVSNNGEVTGNHGDNDFWIVKLDTNGTLLWEQSYGGILDEQAHSMIATNDNGLAITGISTSNSDEVTGYHGGVADYWVVKLNPDSITGIKEINNNEGVRVYPNPVSETLTIRDYELGIRNGEIEITDVMGGEVYHSQFSTVNSQLFTIDVSDFSNGMYFYRITSDKETMQGKFIKQ
jgi:type IX secretion system substrate protein